MSDQKKVVQLFRRRPDVTVRAFFFFISTFTFQNYLTVGK